MSHKPQAVVPMLLLIMAYRLQHNFPLAAEHDHVILNLFYQQIKSLLFGMKRILKHQDCNYFVSIEKY